MAGIAQKLLLLQPKPIDPTKCTPNKSLYEQVIQNSQATSERQAKQFNLGNSFSTANPIEAAEFILEREYGESSLFVQGEHKSVFIPPLFVSSQYKEQSSVAVLDYDVKGDLKRLLNNLKQHSSENWLSKELDAFMQTQNGMDGIDKKMFDKWVLNLKIMYLVIEDLKTDKLKSPKTTSELGAFVQVCIQILPLSSALKVFLQKKLFKKNFKLLIKEKVKSTPSEDSNLQWLFGLELAEVAGEKLEHWFYDQLLPLEDDTLKDTVVLSSTTFLTDVRKKKHKETDFLIISWQRKLIISVEMKRTLVDDKVFKQLESNHQVFQEKLGDQLKSGWTYFPAVCVENDTLSVNSQHYITMETEIEPWLSIVLNKFPVVETTSKPTPLDEVKGLLKILIFAIHVSKKKQIAPITTSTWVEYTSNAIENVSTSNNILFYSNQQMAVMNSSDPRHNKLIICGPFGVGKSLLLQKKAIQLNEKPEYQGKVLFMTAGGTSLPTMLHHRMKVELEENHGILVDDCKLYNLSLTEKSQYLIKKIKEYNAKAVLIDEYDMLMSSEQMKKEVVPNVDFLWVVPTTQSLKNQSYTEWLEMFSVMDLSQNFRNSREIVKYVKNIAEEYVPYNYKKGIVMPPKNFPSGCKPMNELSFKDAVIKAQKQTKRGIMAICPFEIDRVISITLNQLKVNWKGYHRVRNDFREKGNPFKFLEDGNFLITSQNLSLGFEWPTVIIVLGQEAQNGETFHVCNYMMRCTTNLIVVRI